MYSFSIRQFIREYIGDFYDSCMFGPNFIVTPLMFGFFKYDVDITCSLGCFTKHFIDKFGYKMVLRQPTSRQQVGTLYEMTSPSSLWNASPQTTRVQRHAARHRATTQLSSIKCCSNLGVVFEALLQYGKTYVYKMPFPQAVANPSDLIHWRSDVQLVWL